jgi:hypothetical protein
VPIRDLVLAIALAAGRTDLVAFGALAAPDEPAVVEGDGERLRGAIRFEPRDLDEGGAGTVRRHAQRRCT